MRRDPLSGRLAVVAPVRARRPGARRIDTVEEPCAHDPACPFCEGNESQTPPETLAVAGGRRAANTPGWRLRVVPNLFPALADELGRQEVVVHAPRHVTSIADLGDGEVSEIAAVWQARARAARRAGFPYLHALVNEGRAAGSSLPHSHSQLVWLPSTPPAVEIEIQASARERCSVCALLETELASGERVVSDAGGLVALCPPAGRAPYEALVAPRACEADAFASGLLPDALRRLAGIVRALHGLEGRAPLNAWLHTSPVAGGRLHWHLELVPRLTVLAGLELGAGLYVNPLAPEDAAAALRAER